MISEILSSSFLVVIVYVFIKFLITMKSPPEGQTSVSGVIRELGLLELFYQRYYKVDGYLLCIVFVVDSRIQMDACKVEEGLHILAKRHPLLQSAIKEVDSSDGTHYYFTKMASFRMEYQESDKLATEQSHWHDVTSNELLLPLNDCEGPLWRCCRLQQCTNSTSGNVTNCFVFTLHHAIMDGTSMPKLFDEFLSILDQLHKNEIVEEMSYGLSPSCETLIAAKTQLGICRKFGVKIVNFLLKMGLYSLKSNIIDVYFKKYPVVSNMDPHVKAESRAIFTCFSRSETDHLVRVCKQHGCKVNGAITAAANMAMADILQNGHVTKAQAIRSSYIVNCRRDLNLPECENTDFLGLCISDMKGDFTVPPYDLQTFPTVFWKLSEDITHKVHKSIERKEYLMNSLEMQELSLAVFEEVMHSRVWKHHGGRLGDKLFELSNIGRFDEASDRLFRTEKMFFIGGGHNKGELFNIMLISVNGTLCCSFVYYPHVTSRKQAEEFNCKFLQNLQHVCAASM